MPPEEREVLAGELALGLLEGEERAHAVRLHLSDPAFADAVSAWQRRFEPLYAGFAGTPSPSVWTAIQYELQEPAHGVVPRSLRLWRASAIASGAVAAILAALLVLRPAPIVETPAPLPGPALIAQLGSEGAPALLAASFDPGSGVLRIRAVRMPESELSPELWVIPSDGVPRSVGLVQSNGISRVEIAARDRDLLQDGVTLAITLEPREGAPHRAPSSSPVAAGKICAI